MKRKHQVVWLHFLCLICAGNQRSWLILAFECLQHVRCFRWFSRWVLMVFWGSYYPILQLGVLKLRFLCAPGYTTAKWQSWDENISHVCLIPKSSSSQYHTVFLQGWLCKTFMCKSSLRYLTLWLSVINVSSIWEWNPVEEITYTIHLYFLLFVSFIPSHGFCSI